MKTTFSFLFIIFGLMCGCQRKIDDGPKIKKGMIKMAILYPNGEGKIFDMDYYVNKHMTLAKALMGDSVKLISIDKGLSGGSPDAPLPFLAIGYFYFETMSALQNSMGLARDKLVADVPNYTNIQPIVQISEVQQ